MLNYQRVFGFELFGRTFPVSETKVSWYLAKTWRRYLLHLDSDATFRCQGTSHETDMLQISHALCTMVPYDFSQIATHNEGSQSLDPFKD